MENLVQSAFVGESIEVQSLIENINKIAQTESTVLITGESGCGKELAARLIHERSARVNGPMIVVNCAAIPAELLEAELFGHVKGAFTGATQDRKGRFETASGGTIFLDEVGDLPLNLQVKLLRVLQSKTFELVGSSKTIHVDVRIIAATNVDLEDAVAKKLFREDLYYRLNVLPIRIPALRERRRDIPLLASYFIARYNQMAGKTVEIPTGAVMDALVAYDWPGNVRELQNIIERLVILKGHGALEMDDLPKSVFRQYAEAKSPGTGAMSELDFPRMGLPKNGLDLKAVVSGFENHLIDQALSKTKGNKNRASELLRMNRTTLVEKLRKRGMIVPAKNRRDDEDSGEGTEA